MQPDFTPQDQQQTPQQPVGVQQQEPQPVNPPVAQQPPQSTPPVSPPPKKSHKGLIALLVGIPVFLFIIMLVIAVFAFKGAQKKAADINSSANSALKDPDTNKAASDNNAVTAKFATEFEVVCHGGSIANAAVFNKSTKPYKVNAFSKDDIGRSERWSQVTLTSKNTSTANYDTPTEASVTACLKQKSGSAEKAQVCEFESAGQKVSIDYYSLKYELVFRESKTGKQIGKGADINGPATKCPMFASYDKSDPKLYAAPDKNAVDDAVKLFAQ